MTDQMEIKTQGRVLTIAFNRPAQINAITQDMYAAIADGLDQATNDDSLRAVLITGNGPDFSAGNDVKDFMAGATAGEDAPVVRFLNTIREFNKPIIAAVNGRAIGVAVTMLLHCDMIFGAEGSSYKASFAHLGVVPEAGSSILMPRSMGLAWANDMLLGGRTLNAQEALTAGLISRVFKDDELIDEAMKVANDVAAQAPTAMRRSKQLIRDGRDVLGEHMKKELVWFGEQLQSPEFIESVTAVMQKRAPNFD